VLKDIRFSQYTIADMDCQPNPNNQANPILKLTNDAQNYFICTLKPERAIPISESTFKTSLYVELEYGYMTTKSANILIKKANN